MNCDAALKHVDFGPDVTLNLATARRRLRMAAAGVDILDEHFGSSFGIIGGKLNKTAGPLFPLERARRADACWHAKQVGQFLTEGE